MATITLPDSIIKRLEKVSSSRRTPESIIKQAVKERLEYEEWALKEIDAGIKELDDGKAIPDAEFRKMMGVTQRSSRKAA